MTKPGFESKRWMGALLVAGGLSLSACGGGDRPSLPAKADARSTDAASRIGVKALSPARQLDGSLTRVSGVVRSKNQATLSSQGSGTLAKVLVNVGDRVKKGQVLAQLDDASMRIGLEQARASQALAEAALDGAKSEVERARSLAENGSLSRAGLEKAEVGFRQAQAQAAQSRAVVDNGERVMRDSRICAPFDGVITARLKNVGDAVSMTPATAIFELVDTEGLEVLAQVPEAVVDSIGVGTVAQGRLNPSGVAFEAKVTMLGAVIDPKSRTVELLADVLPQKDGKAIRPGALLELDLGRNAAVAEAGTDANAGPTDGLFLPTNAVKLSETDSFVWLVNDGKAQRRSVTVQRVLPGYVRVLSGLELSDKVVADASLPLQDGAALQVVR